MSSSPRCRAARAAGRPPRHAHRRGEREDEARARRRGRRGRRRVRRSRAGRRSGSSSSPAIAARRSGSTRCRARHRSHRCRGARRVPTLIVLDNLEHLPSSFADVAALLDAAPELRILATSRVPLRIAPSTSTASRRCRCPQHGVETAPSDLVDSRRAALRRRAQRRIRSSSHEANASARRRICRALDGLPLAIELAAARVRVLGAEGTAKRLGDALALLTRGRATCRSASARSRDDRLELRPARAARHGTFGSSWRICRRRDPRGAGGGRRPGHRRARPRGRSSSTQASCGRPGRLRRAALRDAGDDPRVRMRRPS